MLGGFNWQRQLLILVFAAAMSLYWTSKQGLWSAISGHSQFDKDWAAANTVLKKKLGLKYEVMEATNQREDKRTLVLSPRQPAQPQTIVAELFPVIRQRAGPKKKARFGERPKKKTQKELQQERDEKRRQQRRGMGKGKRGKAMEPKEAVGRLRIYDERLGFLKDLFMEEGVKRPESLIEVPDPADAAQEIEEQQQPPPGALPKNPIPRAAPQAAPAQHELPSPHPHAARPNPHPHAAHQNPHPHPAHPAAAADKGSPPDGSEAPRKTHTETEL